MKDKAAKRAANRLRDKRRRKRKHARQIESRLKNEYCEYLTKMNQFEYHTWLSEVTNSEEEDKIYCIILRILSYNVIITICSHKNSPITMIF